jgi:dienelactone hydrolase
MPGMEDVIVKKDIPYVNFADSTLNMDIYYPPDFDFKKKIPAVIFIYGYTEEAQRRLSGDQFRNWSWHISWCKIIAASGIAAIVYETVEPVNDLASLAKFLQSNQDKLLIDINYIGAFTCSAHTPTAISYILDSTNSIFNCAVVYYGFLLTQNFEYLSQVDTIAKIRGFKATRLADPKNWRKDVPILIFRAGLDNVPYVNESIINFFNTAIDQNLPVTLENYPTGHHGFDGNDNNTTTRLIIKSTLDFWKVNLTL